MALAASIAAESSPATVYDTVMVVVVGFTRPARKPIVAVSVSGKPEIAVCTLVTAASLFACDENVAVLVMRYAKLLLSLQNRHAKIDFHPSGMAVCVKHLLC
jgi:hypothetical protein